MDYTLRQLQIFIKVAELQSVTRASEELFLTQPAVSIQLKKLQDQFDVPLTEVIGRKLYITDFGSKIQEVAKKILEEADRIDTTVKEYKGVLSGKVKISIVSTGKYVIPYFLSDFIKNHPGVTISIDVTNKSMVIDSLSKNATDFALISVLTNDMNVERVELMPNELYLVCPPDFEYPKSKKGMIDFLKNQTFIFREKGSATRNAMELFLDSVGIKVKSKMELVSIQPALHSYHLLKLKSEQSL